MWNSLPTVLLCLGLLATGDSFATSSQDARLIAKAAARGSASAQVILVAFYRNGDAGYPRDDRQATRWFEMAALQGNAYAQAELGEAYSHGRGVPRNLTIAENAAKRGNVTAQLELGKMYRAGEGVAADKQQAIYWLRRAAVHGNSEAEYLPGRMYRSGTGVPANPAMANDLLARSAAQGYADTLKFLQFIENFGYEIDEDLHQGPAHLEQLAADGDAEAAYHVAMRYENGAFGVAQNNDKALYWFKKAAANGSTQAMTSLAAVYAEGLLGVKADQTAAQQWRKRSADLTAKYKSSTPVRGDP